MWIRALGVTACSLRKLDDSAVAATALIRKLGQSGHPHMEVKLRRSTRKLTSKSITIADVSVVKEVENESEANEEAQELPSLRDKLIILENENRLNTLRIAELRGIMKQISRSTTGTKKMLLQELSKFLHPESFSSEGQVSIQAVSEKRTFKRVVSEMEDGCRIEKCTRKVSKLKTAAIVDASEALKSDQPWAVLVHKKPKPEWVPYNPCTVRPTVPVGSHILKVVSWNVNGLRALLKRKDERQEVGSALARLAETEDFDIICLQETKLQEKDVEVIKSTLLANYFSSFWTCSISKLGYSGSAFISRMKPLTVTYGLGNPVHDTEGRIVTAEFDSFFLVTAYVPNSGQRLERLAYRTMEWDPAFSTYLMELQMRKPVVLTGDLNCAHQEIDIHDPDRNRRSAGFTDEERNSFEAQFLNKGLVDTFRKQHPHAVGFTYWNYRTNARCSNKGWRLDYFLVSEALASNVVDSYTLPHIDGSDHCPIGLILNLTPTLRCNSTSGA